MRIELEPIKPAQKHILERYLQFYYYDYAEVDGCEPEDGYYHYRWLDYYFEEGTTRFAYFIRAEGHIAGFALVRTLAPKRYQMSEFFVMNIYRRHGVGVEACRKLFALLPGKWEMEEDLNNHRAIAFWRKTIKSLVGPFKEEVDESNSDETSQRLRQIFKVPEGYNGAPNSDAI